MILDRSIKIDFKVPRLLEREIKEAEEIWDKEGDSSSYIFTVECVESDAKQAVLDNKITPEQRTKIFNHFGIYS